MQQSNPSTLDTQRFVAVGRVITAWAALDYALELIIWNIVRLEDHHGRILTSKMLWAQKAEAIRELLAADTSPLADRIRFSMKALSGLSDARNQIAHGIWITSELPDAWHIVSTRTKPVGDKADEKKPRARVAGEYPSAPISLETLGDLVATMTVVTPELLVAGLAVRERQGGREE